MMARLGRIVCRVGLAIAFMCEIAALTILAAIATKKIAPDLDAWMAVVFFAVVGGFAWMVGHTARSS